MYSVGLALFLATALAGQVYGQSIEESFQVYTEHPRLLLNARRLKLVDRERQRQTIRWMQFETLVAGGAQMPERGFAYALYYRASGDKSIGDKAVEWATGPATDIRQVALVFDWCQPLLSAQQSALLVNKLRKAIDPAQRALDVPSLRDRAFAAAALTGHVPDGPQAELRYIVETWWRKEIAPQLAAGRNVIPREHSYALLELLHAVRDNLNIDMREGAPAFFKELPMFLVLSYYPASYPAAENEYRIPYYSGAKEPDLNQAALSRAADLALVAFDTNAVESQFLQGWLIQDRFLLRSTYGIPYEFLWANPYQPGLSYYHLPNLFHDKQHKGGRLLVRSSWDDDAVWYGYLDGKTQLFKDGKVVSPGPSVRVGEVQILEPKMPLQFRVTKDSPEHFFLINLKPGKAYEIEVDDEELRELYSDAGGILSLTFAPGTMAGVRVREGR
jgi:hypothetical protein